MRGTLYVLFFFAVIHNWCAITFVISLIFPFFLRCRSGGSVEVCLSHLG